MGEEDVMESDNVNDGEIVIASDIPLKNIYQPLVNLEEENNSAEIKVKKPPPIVLPTEGVKFKGLIEGIKKILKQEEFRIQYLRKNVKIYTDKPESYDIIKEALKKADTPFYTYNKREEKIKKMVFKGPPNLEIEYILDELRAAELEPIDCIQMKTMSNKPSHSYLVTVPGHIAVKKLRELRSIDHAMIKWEYYSKKNSYTQCHKCQQFGHGSRNCYMQARCVKCAKAHDTRDCAMKKTDSSKPKCCNCQGEHTANYTQCPALLEYLEKIQNSTKKQQEQKTQVRNFEAKKINPAVTYANAMNKNKDKIVESKENLGGFEELNNIFREIESKHNLSDLIEKAKKLGSALDKCKNEAEKLMVVFKFMNP